MQTRRYAYAKDMHCAYIGTQEKQSDKDSCDYISMYYVYTADLETMRNLLPMQDILNLDSASQHTTNPNG